MILRHLVVAIKGAGEAGSEWLIGIPWYDVVIHSGFVVLYIFGLLFYYKSTRHQ
ncbi:MAG: hypothetical protein OEZ58_17925 [Gammaproteobacteria bacterium]|nr:hypothetical protein [Gammaproteobacteria bacterium]MDH5730870.1 hypothetical protein [Gammaproteobacteria bacterium]